MPQAGTGYSLYDPSAFFAQITDEDLTVHFCATFLPTDKRKGASERDHK